MSLGDPLPRTVLNTSRATLKRQIGFRAAVALIVGEVIAVGIFLTPSGMAKSLGSPFWLLVVWLVMGGMALCGALCYGELASRYPEAGGGYVYLREAYGRPIAFLYGWMALLVMDPGLTAALAVGLSSYAGYTFGLTSSAGKAVAIAAIVSVALVNIRGVKFGGALVTSLTILKLGLLLLVIAWSFGTQGGNWSNFQPLVQQRAGSEPFIGALAGGLVG
ncbi:MAG TPA: amino acid permease, partial [Pyrinomonadaceae bacterium]